uniref:40S ribosomal protein S27 n=1 Tax=Salmo salar TaxID=8030 RepID=B5X5S1_SALSA|nr:40S ribosomal protein S27 [Salmo salar]
MALTKDLMHPTLEAERQRHKKKRLVQSPNSYFMDVKCPGCYRITTVFSHAQRVVPCGGCSFVLCQPRGEMPPHGGLLLQKKATLSEISVVSHQL